MPPIPPIPPENYSPVWPDDAREPPPLVADERELLVAFLDWHRTTLAQKCAGVPPERLREKAVPPSTLSLHGLVRHLAGAEQWWFRIQFAGEDVPMLFYSDDDPDQDFEFPAGDFATDLALWQAECALSREIVAGASLDDTGVQFSTGEPVSLRRIMLHMVAEYARHNGHADLLRERIDGATGH
jgi:hypothetical protein